MRFSLSNSCSILLGLVLALVAAPAVADNPTQVVHIQAGGLVGVHVGSAGLNEFKGIPYAAPPIGALRWRPPQRVAAWTGVRKAVRFGPRCMQRPVYSDMVFRSNGVSEDCLYLNVWTPQVKPDAHLPVLVYFYGGGFIAGDSSEPRYDGASLAERGIVTVTVNYRLGVFGFLALPALADESPHHASGNYGFLDQVAALRWVHRNIAAFGGDPLRVTIGGESAGSMSVSALLASPLARGLVHQAIGESGAVLANLAPTPQAKAQAQGEAFVQRVGAHSLAQLRGLPARVLLAATGAEGAAGFGPTLDGYFLARSPQAIYQAGAQAHVPLLVGSNSEEGSYADLLQGQAPTPTHYRAVVTQRFGADAAEALKLYPGRNAAQVKASGTALAGDAFIALATWKWMDLQRTTSGAPVYYYYFTKARPATRDGSAGPGTGAPHSSEIEYALGNLSGNQVFAWTPADQKVSATMEGYFANFIKTGNPNGPGLARWPAAAPKDGGLLRQVIGIDTHTIIDRNTSRYAFLERHLPGN